MPRHLISDAHEWINEIPTVPDCYLANPQPRERAWDDRRGKKTLLSLTLVNVETVLARPRHRVSGRLRSTLKHHYAARANANVVVNQT